MNTIAAPAPAAVKSNAFNSLTFRVLLALLLLMAAVAALIYSVINRTGRPTLVQESDAYIRSVGMTAANSIIGDLERIDGFVLSNSHALTYLPVNNDAYTQAFKGMLEGTRARILSAGIWGEPGAIIPGKERNAMFWLHKLDGTYEFNNDYNDITKTPKPYYREEWYVPAKYSKKKRLRME